MANTLDIPIFGVSTAPDNSGDIFVEPASVKMTTAPWGALLAIFKDTSTRIGIHGSFRVPRNYSAATTNPTIVVPWSSGTTSNNVVFDFDYRAHAIGEGFNQSGTSESVSVTDAAPGTAWNYESAILTLNKTLIVALDIIKFTLFRDGSDASDNHAADIIVDLENVEFSYDDG